MSTYSTSDKLAIALACLTGIMAIILFLVEKTPATVVSLLLLMLALSVYPILHFAKRIGVRMTVFSLFVVGTLLFGWYVWPHNHPISANNQETKQSPQEPQQPKSEEKKSTDEKKDTPPTKKKSGKKPKEESAQSPNGTAPKEPSTKPPQPNVTVNNAPNGIANSGTIQGNATVNNVTMSREITPKAADEIRVALSGFPKLPVLVSPVPGDGEEMNLVYGIEDALSQAGLDVGGGVAHYIGTTKVVGVMICPRLNPQDVKAAQILADILNRNGVDTSVNTGIAPPPAFPGYTNILVGSIPPKRQ